MTDACGAEVAPTFERDLGDGLRVRLWRPADAAALFSATDRNREHLREWLAWMDETHSEADSLAFILTSESDFANDRGMHAGIWMDNLLVGGFGQAKRSPRVAVIGYWLDADHWGRGIMTRTVTAMLDHLFLERDTHRIEIQAAVENRRSRAVAERLGFRQEGVLRHAEYCAGRWLDNAVYGLLEDEWGNRPLPRR